MSGLSEGDVKRLVNRYIGVNGGYLGDFSYKSHADFYPEYCDLDMNPSEIQGTTRVRFEQILLGAAPHAQASIIRGILEKYPPGSDPRRTQPLHDEFADLAKRLDGKSVPSATPRSTSKVVQRAIADAEKLIESTGATSGVDRLHTALHGHMKAVCDTMQIKYKNEATIAELFKLVTDNHPNFKNLGPRPKEITQLIWALSLIMNLLNPIRNNASVAHPNPNLLDAPEAMLVINAARSILRYVDDKLL